MRRLLCLVAAFALAVLVPCAGPAAADSSSCTHHWSGPQVCIRLQGRNGWNSVTSIWVNPPKDVKTRSVRLFIDGHQLGHAQTARRVGKTISYHWSGFEQGTDVRVCVRFAGIDRVACERTKYIGDRAQF
ncbi:hypothetical protein [Streptomyces sp. NPDC001621]|uniref:hypothetical protein n=1 Tax=Streptomyces sp. NPDC001621 TaxID=3364594 RepID=UPI0036C988A8